MNKIILLSAVTPADFSLDTAEELREAAQEWGCDILESKDILGNPTYFFVADTIQLMERMVTNTEMPGVAISSDGIYDMFVEV